MCVRLSAASAIRCTRKRRDGASCNSPGQVRVRRYIYELNPELRAPDPASRYQPDGVHKPSAVVDPLAFEWSDGDWRGRPWVEAVIVEVHVGTATPEGTFAALIGKLEHWRDLGATALELMPLSDCPGTRNWGYDGVAHFAPNASYGTPDDLKRLIDRAHCARHHDLHRRRLQSFRPKR